MIRPALISLLASLLLSAGVARADLRSNQVAIIAARGNADSEQLAEYYATVRAIPVTRICLVDVPAAAAAGADELSADAWDGSLRPAIRQWLAENDPDGEIRCLVTIYGVPTRIAPAAPSATLVRYQKFLAGERAQRLALLREAIRQFDALAPAGEITTDAPGQGGAAPGATGQPLPAAATPDVPELKQIELDLERALKAAQARVGALPQGEPRAAAQTQMQQLVASAGGATVIVSNIEQQLSGQLQPNQTLVGELQRLRGAGSAWMEARDLLERQPPNIQRDAALLGIIERLGGQLAAIPWLDAQLQSVARNESAAAFDSELALIRWDANYQRHRQQPNYLSRVYESSDLRNAFPTVMTARLDGPTPAIVRTMIDAAQAAERSGLTGQAYFDARGIANTAAAPTLVPPEAVAFDRAIITAARSIETQTTVPVTLNEPAPLFAAGECPDAALYCGWYSLGNYIDAFTWSPGAVAYHVASDEAVGLHDPAAHRWCKSLLADGVAATIGAVGEASPGAFPRPDQFFGLLLRGDRTLAECYWQTLPHTSWTVALLGDPLYRPYKSVRVEREEAAFRDPGR